MNPFYIIINVELSVPFEYLGILHYYYVSWRENCNIIKHFRYHKKKFRRIDVANIWFLI